MKRIYTALVAVTGFLTIWLGLSPNAESIPGSVSDSIVWTHAQADRAEESKPEAKGEAKQESNSNPKSESKVDAKSAPGDQLPACLPSQALSDLNQRKKASDDRESALQAREQELAVREKAIEERLKLLQSYRDEAGKVDSAKKKEFEEKIARTVELLESMNPKSASQLIASTDERLAVEAMSRMSTAKLSKVMNIMEPKRSVRLMELLAGNGTPAPVEASKMVPESNPKKGEKL